MKYTGLALLIFLANCSPQKIDNNTQLKTLYDYDVEERIAELGIELSEPFLPPGLNLSLAVRNGNQVFLSGNGPMQADGSKTTGKVGTDLTVEEGYQAARMTAINQLSVLKSEIGDLNKVVKIIKVFGMVNADPSFTDHPKVINGFSDLMVEVFGERGKGARSAVGMASLPWNIACEVELIVQVQD